jgi:triacylglycerol esterase/lipase EstA (alpha/beta hydrolase family)
VKQLSGIILFLGCITAQNNYPIVLIHGFMGWGPNEMGGYRYWGGEQRTMSKCWNWMGMQCL